MTEPSRESAPAEDTIRPPSRRTAPTSLAIASITVAIGLTLIELATAVASYPAARDFSATLRAGGSPGDTLTWYDGLELLSIPVLVVAYVVTCLWLQSARATALSIDPTLTHQRKAIWVWLGWWVPIVAFWFPYQVVRDVQEGSNGGRAGLAQGPWWACWLLYLFCVRATASAASSADPLRVEQLPVIETLAAFGVLVACIQWCRIVRSVTKNQQTALSAR